MNDLAWIGPALIFGLVATRFGLPPMVGYLVGGFLLNMFVEGDGANLASIGNLGVTLLLFTIGLKLDVRSLLKPVIWAGTSLHMLVTVALFGLAIFCMSFTGVALLADVGFTTAILIAFALSFSSTVFAVKTLEQKGEIRSRHGQIAIGVLIMQDIFAILFLALSAGKAPSPWALALILLIPLRRFIFRIMNDVGHGELMALLGLGLAFGGAFLFELVSVKGDLGALIFGAILAAHPSANSMAKKLLSFKELLLVGFFLSIGMSGSITTATVITAIVLAAAVILKTALFFWLFTKFKLRSRTAVFSSLNLANFSEFGLIVASVALANQWLSGDWVVVIALALTFTFIAASPLNNHARTIYARYKGKFNKYQSDSILEEDAAVVPADTQIVIIGMASIGCGTYDTLVKKFGEVVVGVDSNSSVVAKHIETGRKVIQADATNEEFWFRLSLGNVKTLLLAMHDHETNIAVAKLSHHLGAQRFAVSDYDNQAIALEAAGVDKAWSLKSQAGIQFAEDIIELDSHELSHPTHG
ncbi:MAG: glutathione-regulated potassium-efflux system ancillary protein KefC [Crocinitomicaceae bacterium]|jgi:glutathione-regulated potassium-efflux system ancillary protein KefC